MKHRYISRNREIFQETECFKKYRGILRLENRLLSSWNNEIRLLIKNNLTTGIENKVSKRNCIENNIFARHKSSFISTSS